MKQAATSIAMVIALTMTALAGDSLPGGITEISVRYGSGWGWGGRMYSVWLKADGTAIFRGDRGVARLGTSQSLFPKSEFSKLAACLVEIDYTSLDRNLNHRSTDGPSLLITIKTEQGKPKEVLLHNPSDETAPPKLWALKHVVDSIAAELDWKDYSDPPDSVKPAGPTEIVVPEFKLPGKVSLQCVAEHAWLLSYEFGPDARGINIILDVPMEKRTRETISIDLKNVSIAQVLNDVASTEGLTLTGEGRTIVIRERHGSL